MIITGFKILANNEFYAFLSENYVSSYQQEHLWELMEYHFSIQIDEDDCDEDGTKWSMEKTAIVESKQ